MATVTIMQYPRPSMLAIYALGVFLGIYHIFFGIVALTPMVNPDYHREVKINFNTFSRSLPYIDEYINKATLSLVLRSLAGVSQVVFGALLLENQHFGKLNQLGNYGLICVDINLLLMLMSIGTPVQRLAPTMVYLFMLVTRLLLLDQGAKGIKTTKTKSSSKPKTSTPKKNKNE